MNLEAGSPAGLDVLLMPRCAVIVTGTVCTGICSRCQQVATGPNHLCQGMRRAAGLHVLQRSSWDRTLEQERRSMAPGELDSAAGPATVTGISRSEDSLMSSSALTSCAQKDTSIHDGRL